MGMTQVGIAVSVNARCGVADERPVAAAESRGVGKPFRSVKRDREEIGVENAAQRLERGLAWLPTPFSPGVSNTVSGDTKPTQQTLPDLFEAMAGRACRLSPAGQQPRFDCRPGGRDEGRGTRDEGGGRREEGLC